MTFDWHVDIGTVLSALGMVAALVAGLYTLISRLCGRLEDLDDRQRETQAQLAAHARDTGGRFEDLGHRFEDVRTDLRELRRWLMADRAGEEEGR